MNATSSEPTAPGADEWAQALPESWTPGARDLFLEVLEQRPDLSGAELGALEQACAMASAAERLDEVGLAAGMVTTGSTGQIVTHPAVVEARLSRTAAAAILARLVPVGTSGGSATTRARAAARARWGSRG